MAAKISDKEIIEYLLGSATDVSAERIDELTLVDDEFSERVDAIERDLVDSYAAGVFDPILRGRFESHYLASPIRREKLRFAVAFRDFASGSRPRAHRETAASSGFWSSVFAWRPAFQLGFSAAVVLAVALAGWFIFRQSAPVDQVAQRDHQENVVPSAPAPSGRTATADLAPTPDALNDHNAIVSPSPKPPAGRDDQNRPQRRPATPRLPHPQGPTPRVLSIVLAPQLRGAGDGLPSISLANKPRRIAATLGLEPTEFRHFRVELRELSSSRIVWRSEPLTSRSEVNPSITVNLPAAVLRSGLYSFSVSGIDRGSERENIGDYAFQVVR